MASNNLGEPREWSTMTSVELQEAQERGDVVLLPVGAVEQHGPHLPVDVDIHIAWEAAREIARRNRETIVLPPIWWGLSSAHRGFAGLLSLRSSTMYSLLSDLCNSLVDQGFTKIVFIVGHGGNAPAVRTFSSEFFDARGVALLHLGFLGLGADAFRKNRRSPLGGEAHGGELETSVEMYLRPDMITEETVRAAPVRLIDPKRDFGLSDAMQDFLAPGRAGLAHRVKEVFPEGVLGDPTVATRELGKLVFEEAVTKACAIISEYHQLEHVVTRA